MARRRTIGLRHTVVGAAAFGLVAGRNALATPRHGDIDRAGLVEGDVPVA